MQKVFLIIGAIIITIGLLWPILTKLPFGKLPLDFSSKIGNAQVFFHFGKCILLSIIIAIVSRLFR